MREGAARGEIDGGDTEGGIERSVVVGDLGERFLFEKGGGFELRGERQQQEESGGEGLHRRSIAET